MATILFKFYIYSSIFLFKFKKSLKKYLILLYNGYSSISTNFKFLNYRPIRGLYFRFQRMANIQTKKDD